jgi:hypothetical protein
LSDKDPLATCERTVRGILQHLVDHPDAKDTIEGILTWWRPNDKLDWRKNDVQEALDFLTSKAWVTVRNTSQSQKIYGFNMELMEEIRKFLIEFEKDKRD